MEGSTTSSISERYAKLMEGPWWAQFRNGSNPWMARYVYCLMFLVTNLLAWAVRDYGRTALTEMKRLKECDGGADCLGAEGVLRISMGCFIFYFTMFLSTVGTSKLHERRQLWHSGWWPAKIPLMISLIVLPFFVPPAVVKIYGDIAHFGAGVFLLIQLVSIISFITWLNDCVHSEKYAERCHIYVMFLATSAYVICILGIISMYIWSFLNMANVGENIQDTTGLFMLSPTIGLKENQFSSHKQHNPYQESSRTEFLLYVDMVAWCCSR